MKSLEATEATEQIFKLIITRHGCPTKLLTDQRTQFTSNLNKQFCTKLGIQKIFASAAHPQTNGKVERFNRFLVNALSLLINKGQTNWDEFLDCALFAYRTTVCRTSDETPFFLLYGRDPILPADLIYKPPQLDPNQTIDQYKIQLLATLKGAYELLDTTRNFNIQKYMEVYNKRHKVVSFEEGEQVMLFWPIPRKGLSKKLAPKWEGPFTVRQRLGQVTYRVEKDNKTYVFHVQRMLKYKRWAADKQRAE
jgi:transposase InsO family protein